MSAESSLKTHLEVLFQHQMGTLGLDVAFQTAAPWTVLFGPSGSGKSTILRVIGGLEKPRQGYVRVGLKTVCDRECGVWVPAHLRAVRWSAQRPFLFPRMTVEENLAFAAKGSTPRPEGLEHRTAPGTVAKGDLEIVQQALAGFRLERLAKKRPAELSGGEAQRVAVARAALDARGKLLLLDEPFSGLDAAVREGLIADLHEWLGPTPVVSVTHDVGEAFLLGADVVRVDAGKVVGHGPVEEVLGDERERLIGLLGKLDR